jgi:hypothetical protein
MTAAMLTSAGVGVAHAQTSERFGLGMFSYQNRTFVGVVVRHPTEPQQIGGFVVELPAAARAANVTGIPGDLLSIMDQWTTVGPKIKQIVAKVSRRPGNNPPAYVHDFKAVDALRPFVPRLAFYGFSNYRPVPGTPPPAQAPQIPAVDAGHLGARRQRHPAAEPSPVHDSEHAGSIHRRRRSGHQLERRPAQGLRVRMRAAWHRGQADASRARGPGEELHVRVYEHERHFRSPGTRAGSDSPGLARAERMGQLQARRVRLWSRRNSSTR